MTSYTQQQKHQSLREIIGKLDFIKIKNSCSMKDKPDWETTFANGISDEDKHTNIQRTLTTQQ